MHFLNPVMFTGRCKTVRENHCLLTVGALQLWVGVGVGKILPTAAQTPILGKIVDGPNDFNSGLDSDSAALVLTAPPRAEADFRL